MSLHHILGHHHGDDGMTMGNGTGAHDTLDDYFAESEIISSWILIVICGVLMCITVPCNLLVLAAFVTARKLRTYGNFFIINLCVADLCVGAINMPLTVLEESMKLMGRGWPFGHIPCHLIKTLEHIFFSASIMTVLIVCNDRYQAIRHPLSHIQGRTTRGAALKIALAWGVASFVWLSFILVWGLIEGEDALPENFCTAMYNTNHYATGVAIALALWIPYPAILIMYGRVYRTIHAVRSAGRKETKKGKTLTLDESSQSKHQEKSKAELKGIGTAGELPTITTMSVQLTFCEQNGVSHGEHVANSTAADNSTSGSKDRHPSAESFLNESRCHHQFGDEREEQPKQIRESGETPITAPPTLFSSRGGDSAPAAHRAINLRRSGTFADNKKATRTLTLIVASYAICWLPYGIIIPITSICDMHPGAFPPLPPYFNAAAIALSLCQSAVNPFCYAAAQPAIRRTIRKMLACFKCRQSSQHK